MKHPVLFLNGQDGFLSIETVGNQSGKADQLSIVSSSVNANSCSIQLKSSQGSSTSMAGFSSVIYSLVDLLGIHSANSTDSGGYYAELCSAYGDFTRLNASFVDSVYTFSWTDLHSSQLHRFILPSEQKEEWLDLINDACEDWQLLRGFRTARALPLWQSLWKHLFPILNRFGEDLREDLEFLRFSQVAEAPSLNAFYALGTYRNSAASVAGHLILTVQAEVSEASGFVKVSIDFSWEDNDGFLPYPDGLMFEVAFDNEQIIDQIMFSVTKFLEESKDFVVESLRVLEVQL